MSETATYGPGRIVVGVDGSVGSEHALRWAARQAELTGAALEIIVGWQFPGVLWLGPPPGPITSTLPRSPVRRSAPR